MRHRYRLALADAALLRAVHDGRIGYDAGCWRITGTDDIYRLAQLTGPYVRMRGGRAELTGAGFRVLADHVVSVQAIPAPRQPQPTGGAR